MNKCYGCGAVLQIEDENKVGFVKKIANDSNNLCSRCFRIQHYNEYKKVVKDNQDFIDILDQISKTSDLVVLVIDIFSLPKDFNIFKQILKNNILLVVTKRDLLPISVKDEKILDYIDNYNIDFIDKVVISSNRNYQFDLLMEKISDYRTSSNVYIVGFTNAGKSTMINKILYNYSNLKTMITTSMLPSTTIDNINIKVNEDLTLIDTPGIMDMGSIINYVDYKTLKNILPKKSIKPITYQIKSEQSIVIEDLAQIVTDDNNLTFYVSNALKIDRFYNNNVRVSDSKKHELKVYKNQDIVIMGLGFIRVGKKDKIVIYTKENVEVFVRESLI